MKRRSGHPLMFVLLVAVALLVLFPLLFSVSLAIQGDTVAPRLLPRLKEISGSAFIDIFRKEPNLFRWIVNSFVVASLVTVGQIAVSALAAYPLALMRFPGRSLFLLFFLGSLMIPWESTIIPNYLTIASLHWKDSYQGLVVPFLASGFGIFLMRQSFKGLPRELAEAAALEGCSRARYLVSFLLPLSRPA
ncbi:MAG TPA: carbohydrate ABC transporter permease, partial [Spirochaetia bacterium]|nr:carbohydrate ABC transporter permease [Spirochaetia bacterium]